MLGIFRGNNFHPSWSLFSISPVVSTMFKTSFQRCHFFSRHHLFKTRLWTYASQASVENPANPCLEVLAIVISQFLSRIGLFDGWKMIVSFWDGLFSEWFVSFRESNHTKSCGFWLKSAYFQVPSGKSIDISLILTTNGWPFPPMFPMFFLKISWQRKKTWPFLLG